MNTFIGHFRICFGRHTLAICMAAALMSACGGGGGGGGADSRPNLPPTADAGLDQTIEAGAPVTLDGSKSDDVDGNVQGYRWNQIAGVSVALDRPTESVTSFVAPVVSNIELLTFELTVTDNEQAQSTDVVMVTVTPDALPMAADDTFTVASNGFLNGDVLSNNGNELDQLGDEPSAVQLMSDVTDGTLSLNDDGSFEYQPDQNYVGTDNFSYRLVDIDGDQSNIATVSLSVRPVTVAFSEATSTAGVGGPTFFGGHGGMFGDANGDGLPDLYVTMNLPATIMADLFYLNIGGGTFREEGAARGIDNFDKGSHGGVWADFDNDGDLDLFNGSFAQNRLYQNDGSGTFQDMTMSSGLPVREWPTRAALAFDMDDDGDLDIFAVTGFQGTKDPAAQRNEVYRNDGNFQFTSINSGVLYTAPAGQGATDVDFDSDGDTDLFAANRTGQLNVLRNDGNGVFVLVPPQSIGINGDALDGITFADVNNDGFQDALLNQHLYLHDGIGGYTFSRTFESSTYHYMGGFADLDNDGDFDLAFPGADHIYLNDGNARFTLAGTFALGNVDDPRSVSFADIEQDGDIDIFYVQKRTFNRLLRNDLDGPNRWLKIQLVRGNGQLGAYGARIYLYEPGGLGDGGKRIIWWESRSQDGYLSQSDPTVHLGVGGRHRVDVRVTFKAGTQVDLRDIQTNSMLVVTEQ